MGYGFKSLLKRSLVGAGFLLTLSQSAFSLDLVSGDFQQILKARSDALTVWQLTDNPNV